MDKNKAIIVLAVIFALTLGIRLFFAFSAPTLTDDDSYFHLRQIEHISQKGVPQFEDPLSYGGRTLIFPPLYEYVVSLLAIITGPLIAGKILTNLFASLLVLAVFAVAFTITRNINASIFSALIAGFIPVIMRTTVNSLIPLSLVLPLTVLLIYSFIKLPDKRYITIYIVTFIALCLTHYSVIFVILSFLVYLLLLKLEGQKVSKAEKEMIIFSLFFFLWLYLLLFKDAFQLHGFSIIWQNVPVEILSIYYSSPTLLQFIINLGTIPVLYGGYTIYRHLFTIKDRRIYLLISFIFSSALLLWLKMITPVIGLSIIGVIATILAAKLYQQSLSYFNKTRLHKFGWLFNTGFVLVIILTSVLPSLVSAQGAVDNAVSEDYVEALTYLKQQEYGVVLSPIADGHIVTAIADMPVLADSNFILVQDAEERFLAIRETFTTQFETIAIENLGEYDVKYIFYSSEAQERYGSRYFKHRREYDCFDSIYRSEEVELFKVQCELE